MYRNASLYFFLAFLVALAGFYPTYLTQLGSTDPVRHFHGIMATLWMLLLMAQAWFMRRRKVELHRRLGRMSLLLVPLFVLSGTLVVHAMLSETSRGFVQAYGARLAFLDVTSLAYFVWTYTMALRHRRDVQLHQRYMSSTVVLLLPPALARLVAIRFHTSFDFALHASFVIAEAVTLALLADDKLRGKVRAPYLILLGFTVFQHASVLLTPQWTWWNQVCHAIGAW
ncbi:MAG: hypothetical protein ACXU8N_11355 [Telluria sp.]